MQAKLTSAKLELTGDGFAATIDFTAGPSFQAVTVGDVILPDWESTDQWQFPVYDGVPIHVFRRFSFER